MTCHLPHDLSHHLTCHWTVGPAIMPSKARQRQSEQTQWARHWVVTRRLGIDRGMMAVVIVSPGDLSPEAAPLLSRSDSESD